jgi:hypothetical protein
MPHSGSTPDSREADRECLASCLAHAGAALRGAIEDVEVLAAGCTGQPRYRAGDRVEQPSRVDVGPLMEGLQCGGRAVSV